jgi:hypothetical protein
MGVAGATGNYLADLAIGPVGSEAIIISNLYTSHNGGSPTAASFPGWNGPFDIALPAGTRISARAQCSNAALATRILGLSLYGLG